MTLIQHEESDCGHLIERLLSGLGHETRTFAEEKKAVAWLKDHSADLAIVSYDPARTNAESWERIRERYQDLKILVLTHYATRELAMQALGGVAEGYICKPVDLDRLENTIHDLSLGGFDR